MLDSLYFRASSVRRYYRVSIFDFGFSFFLFGSLSRLVPSSISCQLTESG
jgi:hypothetical protein